MVEGNRFPGDGAYTGKFRPQQLTKLVSYCRALEANGPFNGNIGQGNWPSRLRSPENMTSQESNLGIFLNIANTE